MGNVKVNENMQAAANDVAKSGTKISFNKPSETVVRETVTITVDDVAVVDVSELVGEKKVEEKKDEPDFLKGLF
jgi:hypothetical protein